MTAVNSSTAVKSTKSLLGPVGEICECRPSPEGVTDLWASSGLYLKAVAKISITVAIPFVKGKEGSRVVSNSEVIANIKKLVTPREFKSLRILKETNTFLRYLGKCSAVYRFHKMYSNRFLALCFILGEIEEKKDLAIFVSKLNGSFIQLKSFGTDAVFKVHFCVFEYSLFSLSANFLCNTKGFLKVESTFYNFLIARFLC